MTATAAFYVLDFYSIINFEGVDRSFFYKLMLISILWISISLPLFVHTLLKVKKTYPILIFTLLSVLMTMVLLFSIFKLSLASFLTMLVILFSNIYTTIRAVISVLKWNEKKARMAGLLFILSYLLFFLALYRIDIQPDTANGFLFFPLFYFWVGISYLVFEVRRHRNKKRLNHKAKINGSEIPEELIKLYQLTGREAEIAQLLITGLTYRAIGERLHISPGTVSTHVMHIYQKTNTRSKIQLNRLISAQL